MTDRPPLSAEYVPATAGDTDDAAASDAALAELRRRLSGPRLCPTREPEPHELGEFPMTCHRCHMEADS